MKNSILLAVCVAVGALLSACGNNDDEPIFEKSADERVAEAVAGLEQKLTAPANGWIMRYQPVPESGIYNVLLNFDEEGGLRIRTDFGANDNEFYDQTNTFRVDNSLGLELVIESYSFFSYLFEQDGATFEAEYEFVFVNETPGGELVFTSKTDLSFTSSTIVVLEPAPDNAEALLGRSLNDNLRTLSETISLTAPVYRLNFPNRDLSLYLSLDADVRTVSFTYITTLSGEQGQPVSTTTGYTLQGNTMVLSEPLTGTFSGAEVNLSAINFNELVDAPPLEVCDQTLPIRQYRGTVAETSEPVALLPTLFDPAGAAFENTSDIFIAGVGNILDNGDSAGEQIVEDIEGVSVLVLYYINNSQNSYLSLGYLISLSEDNFTIPVKEFTPAYDGNQIQFNFDPEYSFANGDSTATLNTEAMDRYINNITEGGNTRIFQLTANTYEFFNPCTGWSVLLQRLQ